VRESPNNYALRGNGFASNDLYEAGEWVTMRRRLEEMGFVFVRGVIPEDVAQAARAAVLQQAVRDGNVVVAASDPSSYQQAHIARRCAAQMRMRSSWRSLAQRAKEENLRGVVLCGC